MISVETTADLSQAPNAVPERRFTLVLYAATLFVSALLIFAIQPMFTKMVLPKLGGAPSVWSVAMVVFQTALFLGYLYAHLLVRALKPLPSAVVHIAFLAVVATTLPLGIAKGFGLPPERGVTLWLVGLFFASIGLPFVALSASAPLLQIWFATTGHKQAVNPYVLYAASNLGSFAGLIAYPFLLEPLLALHTQIWLWSFGFYAFATLVAVAAFLSAGRTVKVHELDAQPTVRPTAIQWLSWSVLAAIPSALVIAVTAYISNDIAAAPFLWVLPLALYLLTFVAVFRERPWIDLSTLRRLVPYGVVPLAIGTFGDFGSLWFLFILLNVSIFGLIALACHGEAYRTRPHRRQLTEFYLWISFGGAIGGIFTGLVAPNLFNNTYEYAILLAASLLMLPFIFEGGWRQFLREAGPGLIVATTIAIIGMAFNARRLIGATVSLNAFYVFLVVLAAVMMFKARRVAHYFGLIVLALLLMRMWPVGGQITAVRSFFGVHQVIESEDRTHYLLLHGTTIHGAIRVRDASGDFVTGRPDPLAYYYFGGPLSDVIEATRGALGTFSNVAIVGLGAGSLACHRREDEQFTFFEIDPEVVRIARDPRLFRFLSECAPSARIVVGDARLTLATAPKLFDLIVLDAFSSDAIPVHLLTREAFAGYVSRLAPHGVIIAHLSNRHMELVSVVGAVAAADGLVAYVNDGLASNDLKNPYHYQATVVALARDTADLGDLPTRVGWHSVVNSGVTAWTDDYSNVLGAIIRQKFGG